MQIKKIKKELPKEDSLNRVFYFSKDNYYVGWDKCESIEKSYWTAILKNITFPFEIIVTENPKYLPRYGDDVIVILKSDEFASDIEYSNRVKAVFRNYFDEKYYCHQNIFFLPLPYFGKLSDISIRPILERDIDIFFVGQVTHPAREELFKIVLELKKRRKDLNIIFQKTQGFFSGWNLNQYLNKLSNSKICLCPRGASVETYRHFESLHHGCVTVSTSLPDVWYFKGAPIQVIQHWSEFPALLSNLINNQNLLKKISRKSVEHWNSKLSPSAVANFINNSISSLV